MKIKSVIFAFLILLNSTGTSFGIDKAFCDKADKIIVPATLTILGIHIGLGILAIALKTYRESYQLIEEGDEASPPRQKHFANLYQKRRKALCCWMACCVLYAIPALVIVSACNDYRD